MTEPESPESLPEKSDAADPVAEAEPEASEPAARALDARAGHRVERLLRPLRDPRRAPAGLRRLGQQDHALVDLDLACRPGRIIAGKGDAAGDRPVLVHRDGPALGQHPLALRVEPCPGPRRRSSTRRRPTRPTRSASAGPAEQVAAGALVALNALARMATVLLLLGDPPRRARGSGGRRSAPRWPWGRSSARRGLSLGGIAGTGAGRARDLGAAPARPRAAACSTARSTSAAAARLSALVPLFLLWANIDESFLSACWSWPRRDRPGLRPARPRRTRPRCPRRRGLAILAACVAACLVNPSFYRVFPAALDAAARRPLCGSPPLASPARDCRPGWGSTPGSSRSFT